MEEAPIDTDSEEYFSLQDLITHSGLSERTVKRRLIALKKNDKRLYNTLFIKKGHQKWYAKAVLTYVASVSKGITEEKPPYSERERATGPGKKYIRPERRKANPNPKRPDTKKAQSIWTEPNIIEMDQHAKTAYSMMKTETDKRRFSMIMLVLNDWVTGLYSLPQACDRQGGTYATFYLWCQNNSTLRELYKRAEKKRNKAMKVLRIHSAQENLQRLITGYEVNLATEVYTEKTMADGSKLQMLQERKIQRKHVIPNATAVIFGLTNDAPGRFKRLIDWNAPVPEADPVKQLSDDELIKIVEEGKEKGLLGPG